MIPNVKQPALGLACLFGSVSLLSSAAAMQPGNSNAASCDFNQPISACQVKTMASPLGQSFEVMGARCAMIDYRSGNVQRRMILTNGEGHDAKPAGNVNVIACSAYKEVEPAPAPTAAPVADIAPTAAVLPETESDRFWSSVEANQTASLDTATDTATDTAIGISEPSTDTLAQPTMTVASATSPFGGWCNDSRKQLLVSAEGIEMERDNGQRYFVHYTARDAAGFSYAGTADMSFSGKISLTTSDQLVWQDSVQPGGTQLVVLKRC